MGRSWLAGAAAAAAVVWLYLPADVWRGEGVLRGSDYRTLHQHRITYAQQQLRETGGLPGWYSRELLGTPFAANLQNFPLLPTRLVLLAVDPLQGYTVGIALAAALSALAAFALARRLGSSRLGAAAAGFTFAAAGFFSSRVLAGHLPLAEAYPALPVLLLLADRAADPGRARSHGLDLLLLGSTAGAFCLAGHPQLPAYALTTSGLFLALRHPRATPGAAGGRARSLGALGLGAGLALFAWVPMLALTKESTRVLALHAAENDLAFPYRRLLALFVPSLDGWPPIAGGEPFSGYPNITYFWETASYVGVLPWLGALALGAVWLRRRPGPNRAVSLVYLLGALALVWALPLLQPLRDLVPATLLRSPSRAFYVTTLALAVAFGRGVDALGRAPLAPPLRVVLAGAVVAIQAIDVGGFARIFSLPAPRHPLTLPRLHEELAQSLDGQRTGIDRKLDLTFGHDYDDVGGYDSLLLARPYRALLALSNLDPATNVQLIDGAVLSPGALAFAGATSVVTLRHRADLPLLATEGPIQLYQVPDPAPRVQWVDVGAVEFADDETVLQRFRATLGTGLPPLFLPPSARRSAAGPPSGAAPQVSVVHPDPDHWAFEVNAPGPGYLKLVEAYHPGWEAKVDGKPAPVLIGSTCLMAVALEPGAHHVELEFHVPGRGMGGLGTAVCGALLLALAGWQWRRGRGAAVPT